MSNEFPLGLLGSCTQREAPVREGRLEGRNIARRPCPTSLWAHCAQLGTWGRGKKPFFPQKRKCQCYEDLSEPNSNKGKKGTRFLKSHFVTWKTDNIGVRIAKLAPDVSCSMLSHSLKSEEMMDCLPLESPFLKQKRGTFLCKLFLFSSFHLVRSNLS